MTANFPPMLAAAARVRAAVPGTRFLVASFKETQARIAGSCSPGPACRPRSTSAARSKSSKRRTPASRSPAPSGWS